MFEESNWLRWIPESKQMSYYNNCQVTGVISQYRDIDLNTYPNLFKSELV